MTRAGIDVEIMKILTDYTEEIGREINEAGERLTKQALKELKRASPKKLKRASPKKLKRASPKKTGAYSKGWKLKKFGQRGTFRIVIHNADRYMLTSILEHGFRHMPDKSLIPGREHIYPVQEKLNRDFEKAVEEIIKNNS